LQKYVNCKNYDDKITTTTIKYTLRKLIVNLHVRFSVALFFLDVPATFCAVQENVFPSICLVRLIVRFCDVTIPLLAPSDFVSNALLVIVEPLCSQVMEAAGLELPAVHVNTNGRPSTTATGLPVRTAVVGLTGVSTKITYQ